MWPYTDDEAGWLTPPERVERTVPVSINDNDPRRRVTQVRRSPESRKAEDKTEA